MACVARCAVVLVVLAALAAGAAALGAHRLSAWLSASDAVEPADAILVLGAEPTRAIGGANLYRRGIAKTVFLSVPFREPRYVAIEREGIAMPWFEEAGRTLMARRGVPDAAIRLLGKDLVSTVAEAREAARVLAPTAATLVVVTSPYHVRRARRIFRDHLPQTRIIVVASDAETLPADWWNDQEAARNVLLELAKFAWYETGGRF